MSKIGVTYWEADEKSFGGVPQPITRLVYAEWIRDGLPEQGYATAEDDSYCGTRDEGMHYIPDDVRETLALLIAPHLRERLK